MPRALPTQSAVHEALQRRTGERPGDSFNGELGGEPVTWILHNDFILDEMIVVTCHWIGADQAAWSCVLGPSSRRIYVLATDRTVVKPSAALPA